MSRFNEFLSLSTPAPPEEKDTHSDPFENLSWIMEMLEEKQIPGLQPTKTDSQCSNEALCKSSDPDIVSPTLTPLTPMGTDLSFFDPLLEANPEKVDPFALEELEGSDFDLWHDDRWNPRSLNAQMWPSQAVSCYSTLTPQVFGSVIFYIDGGEPDWTPSASMRTTVVDENNNQIFVEMCKENRPLSRRLVCTFHAPTPGFYTVTVCDGLINFHIKGSPLIIPVSRNYAMYSSWNKPRVFYSKAVKAWGITYSTVSNRVYVTDRDAHQIIVYHQNGNLDKCFGKQGNSVAELFRPTGIAADNVKGRLVVSDKDNHRVGVYNLNGRFLFHFGGKGFKNGEFCYPWGVAVSPKDGTIAVADSRNHRIQLFDSNGKFLRKYSVFETSPFEYKTEFNYPRGMSFDITGDNLYVSDFNIQTVFKLNIQLTSRMTIVPAGVHISRPQGVAVDPVGNLLICDSRNNCIRVLSPSGEHISSIVGHPTDSFLYPQDIAVAPTGEVLIVDANSNVRVL